jgi:hypothetical protein
MQNLGKGQKFYDSIFQQHGRLYRDRKLGTMLDDYHTLWKEFSFNETRNLISELGLHSYFLLVSNSLFLLTNW